MIMVLYLIGTEQVINGRAKQINHSIRKSKTNAILNHHRPSVAFTSIRLHNSTCIVSCFQICNFELCQGMLSILDPGCNSILYISYLEIKSSPLSFSSFVSRDVAHRNTPFQTQRAKKGRDAKGPSLSKDKLGIRSSINNLSKPAMPRPYGDFFSDFKRVHQWQFFLLLSL